MASIPSESILIFRASICSRSNFSWLKVLMISFSVLLKIVARTLLTVSLLASSTLSFDASTLSFDAAFSERIFSFCFWLTFS